MNEKILTRAIAGFIDDVENPTEEQVLEAFEALDPTNTEIDVGVDGKWLLVAIDTTGTRYIVSLGEPISGDRLVDPLLVNDESEQAMIGLEFIAQNGEGSYCGYKYSVSKEEARRVTQYFFHRGKLPDDVTLL